MKKIAINAFAILSLALTVTAVSVSAQSNRLIKKVEIPFEFSVNNKVLPAGVYNVERSRENVLLIRSENNKEASASLTMSVQSSDAPETGELIFHRYGDTYFLFQVWERGSSDGQQLLESRTERSIERESEVTAAPSNVVVPM